MKRSFVVVHAPSGISAGWRYQLQGSEACAGKRGEITKLSRDSRRRMEKYVQNCTAKYRFLGTLTVREWSPDGRVFKEQLNEYLRWKLRSMKCNARMRGDEQALESVFWWLEFQARGAPHVHYLYTTFQRWDLCARVWAKVLGDPGIEKIATRFEKIRKPEAMAAYVGKYAAKLEQKEVPSSYRNVGRFWGIRGCRETRVRTLVCRTEQAALDMQLALAKAAELEEQAGNCQQRPWRNGDGVSIEKARGAYSMVQTGAFARMELAIAKQAAQGGTEVDSVT